MHPHNGATHLEAQIDAVRSSIKDLIDRLEGKPEHAPRVKAFAGKVTEAIKAHPIRAIAVALGLGYLVVRVARR